MLSLILPYWDRQEAANDALHQLAETYPDFDMEVIVIDDGNPIPFLIPDVPLNIRVIRLPGKSIPKCPVTAWNEGVKAARGDIIVLSCVEILHTTPILQEMARQVQEMGPLGYVVAAAWCPEQGVFHCHSSIKTPRNPAGTGIAFCAALHRSLFDLAGGFDEAYREGAGYEDNDWINRLLTVGARFVIRDDLVVIHPKTGASIDWGYDKFAINEKLYYSKWPTELRLNSITFCCVNAGNYLGRGQEYVDKLYDMVVRNIPDGTTFKFVCFTDEPGTTKGIEYRALPEPECIGWNHKISLFKSGVFEDGERVVFLDLDTLIIGSLEPILNYQGEFATLRDFWRPEGLGPAIMLWRGGFGSSIWDKYRHAGLPDLLRGDQEWLEHLFSKTNYQPSILQDLYPGFFCSFKGDCKPHAPQGTRIVCFHGVPRPHEVPGWIQDVWSIGGLTGSALEIRCNVDIAKIAGNIRSSSMRDIQWLEYVNAHDGEVALVGGGPSLAGDLEQISKAKTIIAMNGTADYLAAHGITPDIHLLIDARAENIRFVKKRVAKHYYLASQCHPDLFDYLPNATLFHIALNDWDKFIPNDRETFAVGGGHSVGLYAMSLAYILGFRKMHLYGYDSSYSDSHHAYEQTSNDDDPIIEAYVHGRTFKTTNWMVVQVNEFQELSAQLALMGCEITTHGNGLLPYVAWQRLKMAA